MDLFEIRPRLTLDGFDLTELGISLARRRHRTGLLSVEGLAAIERAAVDPVPE
ncbi:MAG: hypothetical protein H7A50_08265 [Akkermansiaceae bacterium]|nr:hypothetical protein [Akkermansiaceae bacterium]